MAPGKRLLSPSSAGGPTPAVRWERPLLWLLLEAALLCILWANVRGSERPTEKQAIIPVTITLISPTNRAVISTATELKGAAVCADGVVESVQVRLRHVNSRKIWPWQTAHWTALTGTNSTAHHLPWQTGLPRLDDGHYEVECRSYLAGETNGVLSYHSFSIDRGAPGISFFPLHDQQTLHDFSDLGGEIDKEAQVEFMICRVNESAERNSYWDGSSWTFNADDPAVKLRAASAGGFWFPSAETTLPKPGQIEIGTYTISASAHDSAGNEGRAAITIMKVGPAFTLKSRRP